MLSTYSQKIKVSFWKTNSAAGFQELYFDTVKPHLSHKIGQNISSWMSNTGVEQGADQRTRTAAGHEVGPISLQCASDVKT